MSIFIQFSKYKLSLLHFYNTIFSLFTVFFVIFEYVNIFFNNNIKNDK